METQVKIGTVVYKCNNPNIFGRIIAGKHGLVVRCILGGAVQFFAYNETEWYVKAH